MPLGHLLHDNYQTRQFNIRSGQYAIISEKDIPPFGSVSVVSKVLLPHRNNIPKPKLGTWKLVSPAVRNSILKLAFEVKQPKKIMKIMHASKLFKLISGRCLKCMLIGGHKDIFSSISVILLVIISIERWYKKIFASISLNLLTESEFFWPRALR